VTQFRPPSCHHVTFLVILEITTENNIQNFWSTSRCLKYGERPQTNQGGCKKKGSLYVMIMESKSQKLYWLINLGNITQLRYSIGSDYKSRQTQHLNTMHSFVYSPTTCFDRWILPSSGRQHKSINRKIYFEKVSPSKVA